MVRIDDRWRQLNSPDFSPYAAAIATRSDAIMLLGADPFAPDACLPPHVIEATKKALDDGKTHYSLANGYAEPELRRTLVDKLRTFNGLDVDPERELMVIPGSAFGLYLAIRLCVRPGQGDEVLNIDPGFAENFNDVFQIGGVSVSVPVLPDKGFQLDLEELRKRITPRSRCIVLTNPNNPTGTVYSYQTLLGVAALAVENDLIVVVDQAFERQVYDVEYTTFASLPGMRDRTITVFGTSKDLGLTGFRVGYLVASEEIVDILKIATFNMHGPTNTFAQYGVAAAYNDASYTDEWLEMYRRRRFAGHTALNDIPGVSCPLPDGGFYLWADISELGSSEDVRDFLLQDAGVGVAPGTWFGSRGEGYLRIMYGAVKDELAYNDAISRIARSLRKLANDRVHS